MKKIILFCSIITLLSFGFIYLRKHESSSLTENPSEIFDIPRNEMDASQKKAIEGDCSASIKLTRYHMYLTLHYDDALKWARVAAKCPQLEPKELLIILLYQSQNQPEVVKEIERLILEIKKIDPKRAIEIEEQVKKMRRN